MKYIRLLLLILPSLVNAVDINSYYGTYDANTKEIGKAASSLKGPIFEQWEPPRKPSVPYRVAVLLPHLEDGYWKSVWYGISKEAERLNIQLTLFDAGGYENSAKQRHHLTSDILGSNFDGLLIGSIKYSGFDKYINKVQKEGISIISIINDMSAQELNGKVLNSYKSYGMKIGEEVIRESAGKDIRIGLFPGPKGVIWAEEMAKGFKQALQDNPKKMPLGRVTMVANLPGEMQALPQARLVDFVLKNKERVNFIVANPIAAQQATKIYHKYNYDHNDLKIYSLYMTPEIYPQIVTGEIFLAPIDFAVTKGEISLGLLVKNLEIAKGIYKKSEIPYRVEPVLDIISSDNVKDVNYESMFEPASQLDATEVDSTAVTP
ncbi:MAG: substrate-binding domain-containing protein [Francisellaceae bacterium]|nr:substrate-binding domain-containing protein [Francisellaceae bacterium]